MKQSVTLKGTQDGYNIQIDDHASFERIMEELHVLLEPFDQKVTEQEEKHELPVTVKTGNRYLTTEQRNRIIGEIEKNPIFVVQKVESFVVPVENALEWHEKNQMKIEVNNVRSGQILSFQGSVLILGDIHPGGIVRAGGSVFILGSLRGLAQAGANGNDQAVVVADFQYNAQLRIGENVHIIEKDQDDEHEHGLKAAYMNDLHIMEFTSLDQVKKLRPALGNVIGRLE